MFTPSVIHFCYLVSAVLFIMALRGLSSPVTARNGLLWGAGGMALAIFATLANRELSGWVVPIIAIAIGGAAGTVIARKVAMTALPQLMAAFHSLVGLAAVIIAMCVFYSPESFGLAMDGHFSIGSIIEMSLGVAIGAVTFTGSLVAFAKLQGLWNGKLNLKGQNAITASAGLLLLLCVAGLCLQQSGLFFWLVVLLSLLLGVLLIAPIGGADMPVIVSMLNSYSGWSAAGIGFTLHNMLLIVTGSLVGASGAILSYIMCKNMNRSFLNVLLGGMGSDTVTAGGSAIPQDKNVKIGAAEDAAFIMQNAQDVIIVPGYGMAVAQAQHAVKEMADILKKHGVRVRYAIHPVAGRMPGHMNVLLAEANVPYEDVFELEDINREFAQCDVAFVVGANDITNPAALTNPASPIFGMPILDVSKAKTVLFVKRSLGSGYAGIENELFFQSNTMMLLDNAKKMVETIIKAMH